MRNDTAQLATRKDRCAAAPPGITLLEVLVACGILMFALSGIAAILPAAGSRLAESVAEDRASLMAANVFTDLQAAGLFDYTLFTTPVPIVKTSGTWNLTDKPQKQLRTLALGHNVVNILEMDPKTESSQAGKSARDYFFDQFHIVPDDPSRPAPADTTNKDSEPWPPLLSRIWPYSQAPKPWVPVPFSVLPPDARRDFFIQDDLQFAADTLASQYENGALGPRSFKRGVCWGATLAARGAAVGPGSPATLTVAIFKKPGEVRAIDLTQLASGGVLYSLPAGLENTRSTFLKPCAYVLAIPPEVAAPDTPLPPKWFRINSSWTQQSSTPAQRISYVSLPPEATDYTTPTGSGKQLLAIGFAGLIRVDEYPVVLK